MSDELARIVRGVRRALELEDASGIGELFVASAERARRSPARTDPAPSAAPAALVVEGATKSETDLFGHPAPKTVAPAVVEEAPPPPRSSDLAPAGIAGRGAILKASLPVLQQLAEEIRACRQCGLCETRTQAVPGVGSAASGIVFVGEAPGADEDQQGIPFVGRAGQLLTNMITAMGIRREEVYIANVIKCRPPQNRNPEPDEINTCEPFLFQQIDVIKPKVIVTLGKFAAQCLLRSEEPISRLRGRIFDYRGAKLIPTFHPAYLLRNPSSKREVWEDMKLVKKLLS